MCCTAIDAEALWKCRPTKPISSKVPYYLFCFLSSTRTPEYRSGGLMRNLENWPFGFGQNFQKFSVFVRMASGVREKV